MIFHKSSNTPSEDLIHSIKTCDWSVIACILRSVVLEDRIVLPIANQSDIISRVSLKFSYSKFKTGHKDDNFFHQKFWIPSIPGAVQFFLFFCSKSQIWLNSTHVLCFIYMGNIITWFTLTWTMKKSIPPPTLPPLVKFYLLPLQLLPTLLVLLTTPLI